MIATTTTFPWGADPFAGVPALRSPTYGLDDPSVSPSTTEAFPASTVQSLLAQHRHATETVARRANLVLATVAKTLGYPLSSVGIVGHGPVAARLTCMVEATTATNLCIATRLPTTTTLPSNEKSPHITTTCDLTRAISSSQPTGSPGIAVVICVPPTALAAVAQLYAGAMTNSNAIVVVIAAGAVTTVVRRMFLAAGMATAHRNVLVIARDPTVVEVDREADRALVRDAVATAAEVPCDRISTVTNSKKSEDSLDAEASVWSMQAVECARTCYKSFCGGTGDMIRDRASWDQALASAEVEAQVDATLRQYATP